MNAPTTTLVKNPWNRSSAPKGVFDEEFPTAKSGQNYAQLVFPVMCSLCILELSARAIALAMALVALFLGYEETLKLLGRTNLRSTPLFSSFPSFRLFALVCLAGVTAAFALVGAQPAALLAAKIVAVPLFGVALVVILSEKHSLPEEILFASTLSLAATPIAILSGVSWNTAGAGALVCALCLAMSVFSVYAVSQRRKPAAAAMRWSTILSLIFSIAVVFTALPFALLGSLWVAALLPSALASLLVVLLAAKPRHLRHVNWALALAHIGSLFLLIPGLQATQHNGSLFF